jgi:hypothetical protein
MKDERDEAWDAFVEYQGEEFATREDFEDSLSHERAPVPRLRHDPTPNRKEPSMITITITINHPKFVGRPDENHPDAVEFAAGLCNQIGYYIDNTEIEGVHVLCTNSIGAEF